MTQRTVTMSRRNSDCEIPVRKPDPAPRISASRFFRIHQRQRNSAELAKFARGNTSISSCDQAEQGTPKRVEKECDPREVDGPRTSSNAENPIPRDFNYGFDSNQDEWQDDSKKQVDHISSSTTVNEVFLRRIRICRVCQESTDTDGRTGYS